MLHILPLVVNSMQHNCTIFYILIFLAAQLLAVAILCTFCVLLVRLESPLPNTNANSDFVYQEPMTSCSISLTPINNYTQRTWHSDTNQNPSAKLPISLSSTLQTTRHFQRTNLNPYLPKMLQSRKLTTKFQAKPNLL